MERKSNAERDVKGERERVRHLQRGSSQRASERGKRKREREREREKE